MKDAIDNVNNDTGVTITPQGCRSRLGGLEQIFYRALPQIDTIFEGVVGSKNVIGTKGVLRMSIAYKFSLLN